MFGNGKASKVHHEWAHAAAESGRRSDGRVFYDGPAFYSFGRHYVAAYRIDGPDGRPVAALFNSDSYSPTTTGHVSAAHYSFPGPGYYVPGLTELAPILDRRKRPEYRKAILAFVERHALDVGQHWLERDAPGRTIPFLLGLAGIPESKRAERAAAIIARAERAAAKRKAKEAAADKRQKEADARHYATVSDSEWRATITAAFERTYSHPVWRYNTDRRNKISGALPDLGRTLRAAHRAASARGWTQVKRKLWARILDIRAALADFESRKAMADKNKTARIHIGKVRQALRTFKESRTLSRSWDWQELARAAAWLAADVMARKPESMLAIERAATQEAERLRPIEEAAAERAAIERAARRAQQEAERNARYAEQKAAWLAGENSGFYGTDESGSALIRATGVERDADGRITGGTLETSLRADAPLTHAIRAFRFVKLCRDNGREWRANGKSIRAGHYRIDKIDSAGNMTAGCHYLGWPELARLAQEIGVFDLPADDSAVESKESA